MSRLTITLSEARYKALKEAAVQRDKTIGQLIDESLDFYGIKSRADARDLVRRARAHSKLPDVAVGTSRARLRQTRTMLEARALVPMPMERALRSVRIGHVLLTPKPARITASSKVSHPVLAVPDSVSLSDCLKA